MSKAAYIVSSMRPRQWTKNLVVFAGLIFSENLTNGPLALKSVQAFLVFCVLSGVIYLINDVADLEKDRLHDTKKHRPLPSGQLRVAEALVAASVIGVASLTCAWLVGKTFFVVCVVFVALNLSYSLFLKKVVLLDVVTISLSFIIRAIAGVEALVSIDPTIELSAWLLICTLFLSLFLAFCKRRHELTSMVAAEAHRETLAEYTPQLIDQLVVITASGAILAYSIYTIWPDTVARFETTDLVYTIPLVLLGVMRYLYLVYRKDMGGSPSDILLSEPFILTVVFLWALLVVAISYVL